MHLSNSVRARSRSARQKLIQAEANHSGRPSIRRQRASSSPGWVCSKASAAAKSPLNASAKTRLAMARSAMSSSCSARHRAAASRSAGTAVEVRRRRTSAKPTRNQVQARSRPASAGWSRSAPRARADRSGRAARRRRPPAGRPAGRSPRSGRAPPRPPFSASTAARCRSSSARAASSAALRQVARTDRIAGSSDHGAGRLPADVLEHREVTAQHRAQPMAER